MYLMRYLRWRIAAARYGRKPWELTAAEQEAIEAQAGREHGIVVRALAAAEGAAVQPDPVVARTVASTWSEGYADQAAFHADLGRGGLSGEGLVRAIEEELRAGLILERIGAAAVVEEEAVRAFFERNHSRLVVPERRLARHILITTGDSAPEKSREQVRERLAQLEQAVAAGADFGALALRHSECPSALDSGRLGEVRPGQLYPLLDAALFSMEAGEHRVAESPLGFHLLQCEAIIPAQAMSYEAAAPSIRRRLEAAARKRVLREWLAANGEVTDSGFFPAVDGS